MGFGKAKGGFCRPNEEAGRCVFGRIGRHAAGEDPAKRAQILEGARQVFMNVGFDAASMNDITRAAGVSKGTIYVYFENKGELFQTIILEAKQRIFEDLRQTLAEDDAVENVLTRFGERLATGMTCEETIRAMRIAIGVAERFPELVRTFFGDHPDNLIDTLTEFVVARSEAGELAAAEPRVAAQQLLDLCTGHLWKMRLFGLMDGPPPRADIERMAERGVRTFMKSYGPQAVGPA
ncbi:TetR/AcrR family transcriptional regulator [Martelella soudanensis]|uniref:TetR/AcrR family transcriptional regulator n=1 Tax=unclassified Martelella TaxID=2629616 RepID=UPI001FEEF2CF|nr:MULTISPECIES: TetR/AcrR family transcriptional regulator [unclassified Martelella]